MNDAGKSAKEAYTSFIWYACFHDTLESLRDDEDFSNLVNIEGKHPEYYRTLRLINRSIEYSIKESEEV